MRNSHIYVFCLLKHQDKTTVNPLDLSQWVFYVLPTNVLDENKPKQKTITLATLLTLYAKECNFDLLNIEIENQIESYKTIISKERI